MSEYASSKQLATATGNPPMFRGQLEEDVERWIKLFKLHCASKKLDLETQRLHFLCLLAGSAENFYCLIEDGMMSLEAVLEAFIGRFARAHRTRLLEELKRIGRHNEESWASFMESVVNP